jgi:hypothetical protein
MSTSDKCQKQKRRCYNACDTGSRYIPFHCFIDVNHGFSLYDENGKLLGQTQAMPGYVNRLFVKFEKPGIYTAFCMELCGNSHHRMRGVVEVVEETLSQK